MLLDPDASIPLDSVEQSPKIIVRRKERRLPTNIAASMLLINPMSPEKVPVRVLDVSTGGMKISCARFVVPGTMVQLRIKSSLYFGDVRYCIASDMEYYCGVRIQETQ